MIKLALMLVIISSYSCNNYNSNNLKEKTTKPIENSYELRFNNLKKIPSISDFINTNNECLIVLLQNDGCTVCNEDKLIYLKDSLIQLKTNILIVINSSRENEKDNIYQLFKSQFNIIKLDPMVSEKLGLNLRQYHLIKFKNQTLLNWELFDVSI